MKVDNEDGDNPNAKEVKLYLMPRVQLQEIDVAWQGPHRVCWCGIDDVDVRSPHLEFEDRPAGRRRAYERRSGVDVKE